MKANTNNNTAPLCSEKIEASVRIDVDLGMVDGKSRRIGLMMLIERITYKYEGGEKAGKKRSIEPGTYYVMSPQATRDGSCFGASQRSFTYASGEELEKAVAKRVKDTGNRYRKQIKKGARPDWLVWGPVLRNPVEMTFNAKKGANIAFSVALQPLCKRIGNMEVAEVEALAPAKKAPAKKAPAKKAPAKKAAAKAHAEKTRKGSTLNKKIHTIPGVYLMEAAKLMAPRLDAAGFPMPRTKAGDLAITVGLGFPSKMALAAKNRRIGEAWSSSFVSTGIHALIVSQTMPVKKKEDRIQLLGILLHEMIHAAVGIDAGHKGPFKRAAIAVGLAGPMTGTYVPDAKSCHAGLHAFLGGIVDKLGAAPWGSIDASNAKKQTTRMIKCTCDNCGFIFRTSSKWIEQTPSLICPDRSCGGSVYVGD